MSDNQPTSSGQTKGQSSIHERLLGWLEKQGYPLELKVGNVLGYLDWFVDYNRYYEDPVTSKTREIDLFAYRGSFDSDLSLWINMVIECKMSREKPWIVLASESPFPADSLLPGILAQEIHNEFLRSREPSNSLEILSRPRRIGHGVVRGFSDSGTGDPTSAYSGVQTAVTAATIIADERTRTAIKLSPETSEYSFDLVVPVVVLDGLLFEYWVTSQSTPILQEVDYSFVLVPDPLQPDELVACFIVRHEYLSTFATTIIHDVCEMESVLENPGWLKIVENTRVRIERITSWQNHNGRRGE